MNRKERKGDKRQRSPGPRPPTTKQMKSFSEKKIDFLASTAKMANADMIKVAITGILRSAILSKQSMLSRRQTAKMIDRPVMKEKKEKKRKEKGISQRVHEKDKRSAETLFSSPTFKKCVGQEMFHRVNKKHARDPQ